MTAPVRKLSLILGLAVCVLPNSASATPANKQAFVRYFGKYLPSGLDTCATCHVRAEANGAESLDEFPHNSFGKRLSAAAEQLANDNQNSSIRDRLILVANEDADGERPSEGTRNARRNCFVLLRPSFIAAFEQPGLGGQRIVVCSGNAILCNVKHAGNSIGPHIVTLKDRSH